MSASDEAANLRESLSRRDDDYERQRDLLEQKDLEIERFNSLNERAVIERVNLQGQYSQIKEDAQRLDVELTTTRMKLDQAERKVVDVLGYGRSPQSFL